MSWRSIQLGQDLCDQDRLILEMFGSSPVDYQGDDEEFARLLNRDPEAQNLILILNRRAWVSEIIQQIDQCLDLKSYHRIYMSINRYCVFGNDTTLEFPKTKDGDMALWLLTRMLESRGYLVMQKNAFDEDRGLYFNFVQPVTWIYAIHPDHVSH
jgi:hypothetical protein